MAAEKETQIWLNLEPRERLQDNPYRKIGGRAEAEAAAAAGSPLNSVRNLKNVFRF